ncbi:MAG: CHAT domain-containing protein [Bryobacteraceae bacterium]|nr:CHAT domain-containing protein [Bryobacteraceae bacterium]
MVRLEIAGQSDELILQAPVGTSLIQVEVKAGVRVEPSRDAAAERAAIEAEEDDVLELELEGGIRQWTSVAQFRDDALGTRGEAPAVLSVPTVWPYAGRSRAIGGLALTSLRLLKVDLPALAAAAIARQLEASLVPAPGLYRLRAPDQLEDKPVAAGDLSNGRPLLILLHGTASRTTSAFGDLADPDRRQLWRRFESRYGDNIFGFEHHTLSASPVENALDLVRALPSGARLHLLSHSRGGLIGELLCRSGVAGGAEPLDTLDFAGFQQEADNDGSLAPSRSRDLAALEELRSLLRDKRPKVERFVRVACPVRGTTLASDRLDRYLSMFVNVLGLIPALRNNPVYEFATALLLSVVKKRASPADLPGLEAMMPDSPLTRIVNRPDIEVDADLSIIAGDLEGAGVWGRLKTIATDLFFQEDHDLIVNTAAMYGGAARIRGVRHYFDQGPEVNHFQYFRNNSSARMIVAGLERADGDDAGFQPVDVKVRDLAERSYKQRGGIPQPLVFLLPGIMGSHLAVAGNRVWLDPADLALGRIERLRIDAASVEPQALVGSAYAELVDYLGATHEVIPFPFDWRRSLLDEGRRLGRAISDKLAQTDQPVRLLCHSMGGLLARAMIAEAPDVWQALRQRKGSRVVMLGVPNGGSYAVPEVLLGRDPVVRLLGLVDLKHTLPQILEIVSRYRGLLEMLPVWEGRDFFTAKVWNELEAAGAGTWPRPRSEDIEAARRVRAVLNAAPIDAEAMLYVAGCAPATPIDYRIDALAEGRRRIVIVATSRGDGRVPWFSGIPSGMRAWYMNAGHGNLANFGPAFPAIRELLETGVTSLLPTAPPVPRDVQEFFEIPIETPLVYPQRGDLEAAALGLEPSVRRRPERKRIKAWVTHGNLAFAEHPVAVGHYEGDSIVAAEAHLDRTLDGQLSARRRLGLYPGPIGSAEVLLKPNSRPEGAIVVGLGRVGELTPGGLITSFRHGILRFAVKAAETEQAAGDRRREFGISTLLVGTGEGGITVHESIASILEAVRQANLALEVPENEEDEPVRIAKVEFVELFEDRAIQAAYALRRIADDASLGTAVDAESRLRRVPGRRQRLLFDPDARWWRRLQVTADGKTGLLSFTALTDRARVEESNVEMQKALIDRFIQRSISDTRWDENLGKTLFELLLPNRLKERTPERRHLVLVVDEAAARYPWELLHDSTKGETEPYAIRSGLIRQLTSRRFREQIVTPYESKALVIGDPPSQFTPLPGARREAKLVSDLLESRGFAVTSRVEGGPVPLTPDIVVRALYADGYRVLHLAGHGVYQWGDGKVTGMVLGPGIFLTPAEVDQMRQTPELVFINCCHLGRIQPDEVEERERRHRHELAANLATQFIKMGVQAVVAAGWAVDDEAAGVFAREFYRRMLDGEPFGNAVWEARKSAWEQWPSMNSWGAYQCYGDHDYRLRVSSSSRQPIAWQPPSWVSPAEVAIELSNLAQDAETASARGIQQQRDWLDQVVKAIPEFWRNDGAILSALGNVCGQLDQVSEAIAWYKRALEQEQAVYPVAAIEQLANLEARQAVILHKQGDEAAARALLDGAKARLERLLEFTETTERLILMAGVLKRQAQIATADERTAALEAMGKRYRLAHERHLSRNGEVYPYPLINWLTSTVLLGQRAEAAYLLREARAVAALRDRREPSFWNAITLAECALTEHLLDGDLAAHAPEILAGYRAAWSRGGSPLKMRSIAEHLDFLMEVLTPAPGKSRRASRARALQEAVRFLRDNIDEVLREEQTSE